MFASVNGLPLHPLVVHAVVVLLPVSILGAFAIAARPAWRARYGTLVVVIAGLATALIPVATSSGEALEQRVGDPGQHAQLGDQLIWVTLPFFVLLAAYVWWDRRARLVESAEPGAGGEGPAAPSRRVHAVLTGFMLVAALASSVQVYRVGDSGARAAWGQDGSHAQSPPVGRAGAR